MEINSKNLCESCPARRIDLDHAATVSDHNGEVYMVSDGFYAHTLPEPIPEDDLEQQVADCKGPEKKLLRNLCQAGLGTEWLPNRTRNKLAQNIYSPDDVRNFLDHATYRDVPVGEAGLCIITADTEDTSEAVFGEQRGFSHMGVRRLSGAAVGSSAKIKKGTVVMLDEAFYYSDYGTYMIRLDNNGPRFAFTYTESESAEGKLVATDTFGENIAMSDNEALLCGVLIIPPLLSDAEHEQKIDERLAAGLALYLLSDRKAIEESEELIKQVGERAKQEAAWPRNGRTPSPDTRLDLSGL